MPRAAVDELLDKFQNLLGTAYLCNTRKVLHDTLKIYNLQVDHSISEELTSVLCTSNQVYTVGPISKGCPLATSFKHKKNTKTILKLWNQ